MFFVQPLSLAARDAIEDLPTDFTSALSIPQHQQVLNAFSRLDIISQGSQRPKLFQLKCLISLLSARHVVLRAATGSGKTLAMILSLLLSPNKIAITVTPLKLLQRDHTQQEKVQKACAKLSEDQRADLRAWEAEKAARAEKERRKAEATQQREARQAAARAIRDARGPTVVFSGTLSSKSKADLLELAAACWPPTAER
ncbi:hypothetical protein BDR04DRAFT_1229901 [Suillus decipiens]|nr:hypothetical protein BDR04DRAFT_1229901 [Suillus decipiens]